MTTTAAVLNATTMGCSLTCKNIEASIRWYREALGFGGGLAESWIATISLGEPSLCLALLPRETVSAGHSRSTGKAPSKKS